MRSLRGRIPGWFPAIADQGVIAATNFCLSIFFSKAGGITELSIYALVSVTLLSTMGFQRTLITDPWLADRAGMSDQTPPQLRGLLICFSVVSAVPLLLVALLSDHGSHVWLLSVLLAPLFMFQDGQRYVCYKHHRTWGALASDATILAVLCLGYMLGWLIHDTHASTAWILGCWIVGYVLSIVAFGRQAAEHTTFNHLMAWWNATCRRLGLPLLQDSIAFFLSNNVAMYVLAAVAGKQAVGMARVINTLYPATMVFTGLTMWLVPAISRRRAHELRSVRRQAELGLAAIGLMSIVAAFFLGPWGGQVLFGPTGRPDREPLLLFGVTVFFTALQSVWSAITRVFGRYGPISWTRTATAVAKLLVMAVVPAARSLDGYLWLTGLEAMCLAGVTYYLQREASRYYPQRLADADDAEAATADVDPTSPDRVLAAAEPLRRGVDAP